MKKQLFWTLVVALGFPLIMTLVINDFIYGEPVESTTGSITREVWTGISGDSVSSIPSGAAPNITDTPPSFEAPTNWADNYGTRMRGYITAPVTGSYTFWIAGDDNSELWLSFLNDNPANKVKIASVPDCTQSREWDKYPTQKSAAINLTQGQRYYVEALQKESGGEDNLAVGWAKPGESTSAPSEVIPGSVLSPFSGAVSATTLSDNSTPTKKIIHWQAGSAGHNTRPSHILNNLAWIDSLPFDGLVCYWDVTYELLAPGNVASYSDIYNTWFAPIKGKLKHVTHNYVTVFTRRSADVFDDWTQVVNNWSVMAQAARDGGFEGILFDNECYYENVWIYPRDMKYGSTKTLSQYQEQFRLRGQQVMQAIIAQWPQAKVIIPHGPYVSDSRTPSWISQMLPCQDANMSGFFQAGMFSAAPGHVIDGGENYQYRGSNFADSKTYRKGTQPNLSPNYVIPLSLRNSWITNDNVSFGIYDRQYYSGPTMNPTVFTQCIVTGATQADELVWTYSEGRDFLTPGGVTQDWLDAVWSARSQLGLPPP